MFKKRRHRHHEIGAIAIRPEIYEKMGTDMMQFFTPDYSRY